jgi:hypothetical protein
MGEREGNFLFPGAIPAVICAMETPKNIANFRQNQVSTVANHEEAATDQRYPHLGQ